MGGHTEWVAGRYVTHRLGGHAYRMGGIHTEWVVIQNGWLEGM